MAVMSRFGRFSWAPWLLLATVLLECRWTCLAFVIPSPKISFQSVAGSLPTHHSDPAVSALFSTNGDAFVFSGKKKKSSSPSSSSPSKAPKLDNPEPTVSKLKTLKDAMWVREFLEDLTAAEFACSLIEEEDDEESEVAGQKKRKRKRAVDYDKLLDKLNQRLMELGCSTTGECGVALQDDGMGSIVYTAEERQLLFTRAITTRQSLMDTMQARARQEQGSSEDGESTMNDPFPSLSDISEILVENIPRLEGGSNVSGPMLYLRDDGTVDWDGALQDKEALQNFGAAVWARINGQDPTSLEENDDVDETEETETAATDAKKPTVVAKIEETEEIRELKTQLDQSQAELQAMETKHLALLNSALKSGQAVASIQLATLEPELRNRIRVSQDELEAKQQEVSFLTLRYELERIFTYLEGEMNNNKGYIPLQDRLSVAEFGLLESQLAAMSNQNKDADVLQVLSDQVTDLKRRLGIDYYVQGLTYDREAIQRWIMELYTKSKQGLAFYVKGCQLFWNDIVFCTNLIFRALKGYTLKPREVRNLRRTFKDVINFIPFVIILIIPLSPVGHVLVFGAIQRVFPDFFPSCFTERRQNLLQLYESTEYSEVTIKENWREQLSRALEAFAFLIVSTLKKIYARITGSSNVDMDEDEEDTFTES